MDGYPPARSGSSTDISRRNHGIVYVSMVGALVLLGVVGVMFKGSAEAITAVAATSSSTASTEAPTTTSTSTTAAPTTTSTSTTTAAPTTTTTATIAPIAVAERFLDPVDSVTGDIAPKSVVATPGGLFFAQNMMYRHSVTVYDGSGTLLATIDDRVDLAEFGVEAGVVARGAPVEAAPTSDGRYVYVSNYTMYGPGFGPEPGDDCGDTGWANSFVYRIDTESLAIDQVIEVGAVPKFVAVTPDDSYVLVTNWCSDDLSIVDTATAREIARLDIGRHPRGIAITSDSSTAYVSIMGGTDIAIVALDAITRPRTIVMAPHGRPVPVGSWGVDIELDWIEDIGRGPRHLLLSPDDTSLYATLNGAGRVVKIDIASGEIVAEVSTGQAPRSMAMSADGAALYVVNYDSNTMSKVLTDTMEEVQQVDTAEKPIGITVDPLSSRVWVSNYTGVLQIFDEMPPEA